MKKTNEATIKVEPGSREVGYLYNYFKQQKYENNPIEREQLVTY